MCKMWDRLAISKFRNFGNAKAKKRKVKTMCVTSATKQFVLLNYKEAIEEVTHSRGMRSMIIITAPSVERGSRWNYMKAHTRKIREDKDFVCDYCGELSTHKSLLKEHTKRNISEKPFVRRTCSKGFSKLNRLRIHQLNHSGEIPLRLWQREKYCFKNQTIINRKV